MFREAIGLFVPEPKAKLYIPKNSGLHEYVNNLLSDIGVSDRGDGILNTLDKHGYKTGSIP